MKTKRKGRVADAPYGLSDDYHAFIAGYTEGGFSYGITWEQAAEGEATTEVGTRLDEDLGDDDTSWPFDDGSEGPPTDRTDDEIPF